MGYGLAHISDQPHRLSRSIVEPVAVVTLDSLVERIKPTRIDFIKADIEGHEAHMIAGATTTLRTFRPVILMEHDGTFLERAGTSLDTLWDTMLAHKYRAHEIARQTVTPITHNHPTRGDILWIPQ